MESYELGDFIKHVNDFVDFFSEMAAKEDELLSYGMKRATTWVSYQTVRDHFIDFDGKIHELLQFARPIDKELQHSLSRVVDESKLLDLIGKISVSLKIQESKSKFDSTTRAVFDALSHIPLFSKFYSQRKLFGDEMVSVHDILVALNRVISLTKRIERTYYN